MKKAIFSVVAAMAALVLVFVCGCGKSEAPVVGSYKLVSVEGSNGINKFSYKADGSDSLITENSFTLQMKDNYKWDMNIALPGISEHEDGDWKDENEVYSLHEDRDDPVIPLTFDGTLLKFTFNEDGYLMAVVLMKV